MAIEDWERWVQSRLLLTESTSLSLLDPSKRNLRSNFDNEEPIKSRYAFIRRILRSCNYFVISTDESFLFYWLILLNIFILYNLWFSIARQAFDPLQRDYADIWVVIDYVADAFYLLDIAIQFRTGYLEQGKEQIERGFSSRWDRAFVMRRSPRLQSLQTRHELPALVSISHRSFLVDAAGYSSDQVRHDSDSPLSPFLQNLSNISTLLSARIANSLSEHLSCAQSLSHSSSLGSLACLVLLHGVQSRRIRRLLVVSEARGQLLSTGEDVSALSVLVDIDANHHRRSAAAGNQLAVSRVLLSSRTFNRTAETGRDFSFSILHR